MRILFVVHYYLPAHQAGTELYTRALARKFHNQGHQVFIFTSEDLTRAGFHLEEDEYEGIKVFRLYHSEPFNFRASYLRTDFDELFGKTLDRIKPDIVHFQHLFRLSIGFINEAYKRNIPAVMTLADYWLICPAIIMLKPEDVVCPGPEQGENCVSCPHSFSAFYPGEASAERSVIYKIMESGLAYAHKIKHQLPPGWVDWMREVIGKKAQDADRRALLQERWQEIKKAVNNLSLLIAPSRFLREMMLRSGMVNEDKIIHSDYGFEVEKFRAGFKALDSDSGIEKKSQKLRLGFIGTLVRHKGLHILIKAIREIQSANFELKIFGSENDFPGYVRELRRIAHKDPRIKWMGKIENDRIMDALSQIDVLVVPSLWYENSPLTIHEAFLAKVPVLVSNLGGMAELISPGGGTSFQTGDSSDLAKKISDLLYSPETLQKWKQNIPSIKTIDQNCQELLGLYQSLIGDILR